MFSFNSRIYLFCESSLCSRISSRLFRLVCMGSLFTHAIDDSVPCSLTAAMLEKRFDCNCCCVRYRLHAIRAYLSTLRQSEEPKQTYQTKTKQNNSKKCHKNVITTRAATTEDTKTKTMQNIARKRKQTSYILRHICEYAAF